MRHLILTATALAVLASAAPAFAGGHHGGPQAFGNVDPRCDSERRTSRNVGGFLGALGGASAGRALAAAAVRPEGVILGTVVGAVVGSKVGSAAVDCTPRPLYTQQYGRSYGQQGNFVQPAPVYQQPVYQQPVYQQPVYQPPVYQQPVYQQPVYQPPVSQQPVYQQPIYQAPVQQSQLVVVGEDWYQPSPHSYYGQERRGPLVAAPAAFGRPDFVPQASYVGGQGQAQSVMITQTYQAGGQVFSQQQGGAVVVAPPGAPCGYQICR
jgi:hypothetical protein